MAVAVTVWDDQTGKGVVMLDASSGLRRVRQSEAEARKAGVWEIK